MNTLLKLENVTKTYKEFCLDHISMEIPRGCIMGFIGENGAGKSTTMKAILGMIQLDEGDITILDQTNRTDLRSIKEEIGVVLSESMLPENMNVSEVDRVMRLIYKKWDHDRFYDYIKQFNLPTNKTIKQFSRGMKMKMNIAIALSHHAKLLLLDEATSGLDPIVRDEILEILMEFIQDEDHGVLISSHITSDIEKCCDYVTIIHKGKILISDEKDIILEQYGVLRTDTQQFLKLDNQDYVTYHKTQHHLDVLIKDKRLVESKIEGAVIDPARLEDIMLLMVKGEKAL